MFFLKKNNKRNKHFFLTSVNCRKWKPFWPRGDWLSFAKVRNLCLLWSCKQTCETCKSHRCVRDVYVLRHPPERLPRLTISRSETKVFCFKYWYFSYKNTSIRYRRLYSLPKAMWGMFYYGWMRFIWLLSDCWKKINTRLEQDIFFSYNSDWTRLKKESHIHLRFLDGE